MSFKLLKTKKSDTVHTFLDAAKTLELKVVTRQVKRQKTTKINKNKREKEQKLLRRIFSRTKEHFLLRKTIKKFFSENDGPRFLGPGGCRTILHVLRGLDSGLRSLVRSVDGEQF